MARSHAASNDDTHSLASAGSSDRSSPTHDPSPAKPVPGAGRERAGESAGCAVESRPVPFGIMGKISRCGEPADLGEVVSDDRGEGEIMAAATPKSPGGIFISYRRADAAYPAGWLHKDVRERFGASRVFKDDSIEPGDVFPADITSALESCEALLAVIGKQWLDLADEHGQRRLDDPRDWVRREIEAALERDVRVIPVLVEDARMPEAAQLPPSLAGLASRQAVKLRPMDFEADLERLLSVLEKTLGWASGSAAVPGRAGTVNERGQQPDLAASARSMLPLMLRNMSSDRLVFTDPTNPQLSSEPGCIIASPTFPGDPSIATQSYVCNWTRDAAIVAIELAADPVPGSLPLIDYVRFAQICQNSASRTGHLDRASFFIDGTARDWSDQADGPALQTLAILQLFPRLDASTQAVANAVIVANLNFLRNAYQGETFSLWEEEYGASFFARSVQLKCLQAITANKLGLGVPGWLATAIPWLQSALQNHWNGKYYRSLLPDPADKAPYDPNIDIVMAAIYGAIAVDDTRLLATAARLRGQWADPASMYFYPVNGADQQRGIGPLLGRYPADLYLYLHGTGAKTLEGGHPWVISTANFAELYYRLAQQITATGTVPLDNLSASFFSQVGVDASTTPAAATAALRSAGDQMLQAVVFHSDHPELSEQFDAVSGYQKSASHLSWSYASFLSAMRARAK
jgi:glucoamylase